MLKKFCLMAMLTLVIMVAVNTADAAERNEGDFIGATYDAMVVNCDEWISLRYAPSTDAVKLAEIPLGTVVVVHDTMDIDGFYPVEYSGMKGYCLKDYLEYCGGAGAPKR